MVLTELLAWIGFVVMSLIAGLIIINDGMFYTGFFVIISTLFVVFYTLCPISLWSGKKSDKA